MRQILFSLFFIGCQCLLYAQEFNILDYGAVPDGKTLCTSGIQAAIEAAHLYGNGRVVFPAGSFLSGSLVIKSGVELHLLQDAVLLGSTIPDHYIKLNKRHFFIFNSGDPHRIAKF